MGCKKQKPWTPTKRRGPIVAECTSPGPACVTLPTLIGSPNVTDSKRIRGPAYSFGIKRDRKDDTLGPGPGQYNVGGLSANGKDTPPIPTLHGRPKVAKREVTPAPVDYFPKLPDSSPKCILGLMAIAKKPYKMPAPNAYNIPSTLGPTKEGNKRQAPAYTISSRQKEVEDDRLFTPAPGIYNLSKWEAFKAKAPAYSISPSYPIYSYFKEKPGPLEHSPGKVRIHLPAAPAYTFSIKHSPYKEYLRSRRRSHKKSECIR